jgi:DNA-binding winged helix-turn-helix (wHTH) protein
MLLSFGDCFFDGRSRQLLRGGTPVHVPPKSVRLLEVLLVQRPAAISKESLIETLWPGVFVADGNLARLVAELREVIGDDAHAPRFVRTVSRYGYAFHGEAAEAGEEASRARGTPPFRLLHGAKELPLGEGENVIGRDPAVHVSIDDASVSRHHARIVVDGFSARLEDLGSKNGTYVHNRRVEGAIALRDGDAIRLGSVALVFRRFETGGPEPTRTATSL